MEFMPVSSIASQFMEDIEHIYGKTNSIKLDFPVDAIDAYLATRIGKLGKGKLLVIATRNAKLREEFCIRTALHLSRAQGKSVAIATGSNYFVFFIRKLLDHLADIPSDSGVYDGQLGAAEVQRLASALLTLCSSNLLIYPSTMIGLDDLRVAAGKLLHQTEGIEMVLVDTAQYLRDKNHHLVDVKQSIVRLKALAEELNVPVIATYQLDTTIENHQTTLTRLELREVETMAALTDDFILMSSAGGQILFSLPKVLKKESAKQP